ncbi:sugar ABC transporter ATP-binding protein [Luteimicrobium xylanilyticum]|uniref:High-affinity branched-chain amino acid transport ATP-binding protein BraF n=1 Tax=Luteimicrobium xylanilyticum TaxID=1133546 RepID=A0A5P9Q9P5_9MICO|nr:sugar ABC transporter ATP-binding protein [Luteimicrobium xylanilyticum]QFU97135.1 High-affinity branched-chain amino acid transport ATP-binding protein BraF [Luteimicrobium xylanilyticum]
MTTESTQTAVPVAPGGEPPVVQVAGVSKRFGATQALRDVQLTVAPGEVHALVGRNGAGKSTLVSILTGLQAPDTGTVTYGGEPAPPLTDRDAWRSRVACVYQHLMILDDLTVAENLFVNRQAENGRPIRWRELETRAKALLDEWEIDVDPRQPARELTVEQRQLVEIARALSYGARFVILDEPTARLDAAGIARLFARIRRLQEQGVTFLYISHHLQEIFDLCQSVTVYRDAQHIVTARIDELSRTQLVEAMTGEKVRDREDPRPPLPTTDERVLEVRDLAADEYRGVSFDVRPGEIVGLAGAGGSGKTALAEALVGLRRPQSGEVLLDGVAQRLGSVPRALAAGIGFVPQDRRAEGYVPGLSIEENLTMTVPHRLGRFGVVSPKRRAALAWTLIDRLDIVPRRPEQEVGDLSGGNQQKVVAGRAIADDPRLLVMMAPTAGVDVKSKESLMATAVDTARGRAGVVVVTDDLDDLRYCHRVLVLFRGDVVAELTGTWDDRELVSAMEGVDLGDR